MIGSTHATCAGTIAMLLLLPGAFAQQTDRPADQQHAGHHDPAAAPQSSTASSSEEKELAAKAQATMDLEAVEAELDLLVTRMNESRGQSKVDAMADLLTTLVRQQRAMCRSMRTEEAGTGSCCQSKHDTEGHGVPGETSHESH